MPITDYCFAGQFHTGTYDDNNEEKRCRDCQPAQGGLSHMERGGQQDLHALRKQLAVRFPGLRVHHRNNGISEVSTTATVAANAPIYNLAGQKRNEIV